VAKYGCHFSFAKLQALNDLDHSQEINTKPLSCDGSETWQHGNSLVNYMKLVRGKKAIKGLFIYKQNFELFSSGNIMHKSGQFGLKNGK